MAISNIPPDLYKRIQEEICRPEGTISFKYSNKELFKQSSGIGILMEIVSGQHLFRMEKDRNFMLHFFHSSPGVGTRVASIDLNKIQPSETVFLCFSWSPKEINFFCGSNGGALISSKGVLSKKQIKIGKDKKIYEIGDQGIETMCEFVYKNEECVLQPTAINTWKETIKAIEILETGNSDQGYIFENIVTNLILTALVTGFEVFAKRRFLEIEQEGIKPNIDAIFHSFFSQKEKNTGIIEVLKSEADDKKITVFQLIVDKKIINFQNYEKCKLAYNKAYGIKFGDLGIISSSLEKIKKFILYRHRIIHVSPMLSLLNQSKISSEEPVFSNKKLRIDAIKEFNCFIEKLHSATLKLRKKD